MVKQLTMLEIREAAEILNKLDGGAKIKIPPLKKEPQPAEEPPTESPEIPRYVIY